MKYQNYFILLLLGFSLMGLSYYTNTFSPWTSGALSNLGTGIFGTIIIYYLIERSIERKAEEEKTNRQRIAFLRIQSPLMELLHFLLNIYKASTIKPEKIPASYPELFNDEYFNNIRHLDFIQNAPVIPHRSWMVYSSQTTEKIKKQFKDIIDSYGYILDIEVIENLEKLVNSHLLSYFRDLPAILQIDNETGYKRDYLMLNGPHELIQKDIPLVLNLLVKVNSNTPTPILIPSDFSRDDVAPKWGCNRHNLK